MFRNRLAALAACFLALLAIAHVEARPRGIGFAWPPNNGGMLLNLSAASYFNNGSPFLNWAQAGGGSGAITVNLVAGGTQSLATTFANGQMDSTTGELVAGSGLSTISSIQHGLFTPTPFASLVPPLNGASPWWNGLAMTVTWTGTSTVTSFGTIGTGGTDIGTCTSSPCTFTFGSNPGNYGLKFAITNTSDPPKNIFVYETKFASNVTMLNACIAANGSTSTNCNHFAPDYLSLITGFGRYRTMSLVDANASGASELSQMAGFDYALCVTCGFQGLAAGTAKIDNGSGSAGNILTVSSNSTSSSNWAIGQTVAGAGISGTPAIIGSGVSNSAACSPACTGTGGNGTYAINGSAQLIASEIMNGTQIPGTFLSASSGSRGGINPAFAVELAKVTGGSIHYNLPVNISNAGMTAVASYFCTNMPPGHKVFYELGNEDWNSGLGITYWWLNVAAIPVFGGTGNGVNWAGYRMGQLMTIVQNVCGGKAWDPSRNPTGTWGGIIGGQMVSNSAVPAAFISGFGTWQSGCSCSTQITDLFTEVVVAPYFSDFPSVTSPPAALTSMISASSACFSSVGGSITASITSGVLTVTAGSVTLGQGLTGAGLPANLYINSGSGPYNLNQNVTVGSESMTTVPCATTYQFFSQQYAKLLITGSNDFSYAGAGLIPLTVFQNDLNINALFANSYGLQLSQYEGTNQVVGSPFTTANTTQGYLFNWQWDAAGNDPNYTPAIVYQTSFQMMRNVHSQYSAKFAEQTEADAFSGVRYFGDSNPAWTATLAENALGPYVDPTAPATWSYSYAGNATNRSFFSGVCSSCTDTMSGLSVGNTAGKIIVIAELSGSSLLPTSVTCNGVGLTLDTSSTGNRIVAFYSGTLAASVGTTSCSVVYTGTGQSFQNREYYTMVATGLSSTSPLAVQSGNPNTTFTMNYTKGGLLIAGVACNTGNYNNTSGVSTPSVSSPTTTILATDIDTTGGRTAAFAAMSAPFSSAIFGINQACNNGQAAVVYR